MNVAFDPWIPVVTTFGKSELVSLKEVFTRGEQFADLAVRPHERIALMRLFLCAAHAALQGPKDYDEWLEVPKRLSKAVEKYLGVWKDSFELFHKTKPWLQVAELTKSANGKVTSTQTEDWTPITKLNFSFATGSNSTLFDHSAMNNERNVDLPESILSMLTFQNYSVGGLIGQIFRNGIRCGELANPNSVNGPVKSADAPCVPSSMIHAFLRANNLLKSIYLNITTHDDIVLHYGKGAIGRPVWENSSTNLNDTIEIENATKTFVGRLVPMTRFIRLDSSGKRMLLGDGLLYPSFINGFPAEPTATVVTNQNERFILSYRPDKAFWRELGAIVIKRNSEGVGGPLSLRNIHDGENCDLIVAALARDKATIVDTAEAVFNIPSRLHLPEGAASYEFEVNTSESMGKRLGGAVETYRQEIDPGWEGKLKSAGSSKGKLRTQLHSKATMQYWTTVEKNLSLLMTHIEAIGTDDAIPTREKWRKMLFTSACEAYRISCSQKTPRQMKAFTMGWQKLTGKWGKLKSNEIIEEMKI